MIKTQYPGHHNSRPFAFTLVCLKWLLTSAIAIFSSACITTASLQEAAGEPAKINVRLLDLDSDISVICSEESPQHNETILSADQSWNNCHRNVIYVNPGPGQFHILTTEPQEVEPLFLNKESDERDLWLHVPDEQCALVLMMGTVENTGFTGLSLSTREKVIKRIGMYFQDDKPGKGSFWFYSVTAAPLADAILIVVGTPFFGAMAVNSATEKPFSDPVTVSFDFPDGTRRQTSLTYAEAEDKLRRNFPRLFSPLYKEWDDIRFWTRAALLDLHLDYREVAASNNKEVSLVQVNQYSGNWQYDPRDGRDLQHNISEPLLDTRYIRYQCSSCEVVPLVGIVNKPTPVPQPPAEDNEHRLLQESADKGNAYSQWHLYLDEGKRKEDWPWLCKAADQRHGDAMVETGNIFWHGRDGIVQDRELGYCWYKAAAEAGHRSADADVMAAEWILSDKELENATKRCFDGKLPSCKELLLPSFPKVNSSDQSLPENQDDAVNE